VVIDYKTSAPNSPTSIHKKGISIREHVLGDKDPNRRYWQIPMYSYGAREGARLPELFCYYVVPPGEDYYVAGLYISDDPDRHKAEPGDYEAPSRTRPFDTVSPSELETVMEEVDAVCDEVFSERVGFPRTDDVTRCRSCSFNRVCERRET
jgi:hypothetical protein